MGWFSGSISKMMKVAQKRHAVPLNKARKIDDRLQNALIEIQNKQKHSTNNEGVQLQAALRNFYSRVSVVKHIERDLVSMAEDIAANEKVVNQLLKFEKFAKATWHLVEVDFYDTYRDLKRLKKRFVSSEHEQKLKDLASFTEDKLKNVIEWYELVLAGTSTGDSAPALDGRAGTLTGESSKLMKELEEAKKLYAKAVAARKSTKLASDLGVEMYDYWKGLTDKINRCELPPISFLDNKKHKAEIEEMRKLVDLELASIMMALNELYTELELFEDIGVQVLTRSKLNRLKRAITQLSV